MTKTKPVHPISRRLILLFLSISALIAAPGAAVAQNAVRGVNVTTFEPTTSPFGVLTLDPSETMPHLKLSVGLQIGYAYSPLRATRNGTTVFHFVEHHLPIDITFALGIWKYFEIGLHLPLVAYQAGSDPDPAVGVTSPLRVGAVGDIRFVPKVRFWRPRGLGFGLALVPQFTLHSGLEDSHAGERLPTFEPKLVLDYRFRQGTLLTANLGFRVRSRVTALNLNVGHEFFYGIGAEIPVYRRRLAILAEIIGAVGIADAPTDPDRGIDEEEIPAEALAAVRYRFKSGWIVTGGLGAGLTNGWGSPRVRVFVSVGWTNAERAHPSPPGDPDGDGVFGDDDKCPHQAEDKDGYKDDDGCPDPDNDGDGVCDDNPEIQKHLGRYRAICIGRDRCEGPQETVNGIDDEDGCPDKGKALVTVEKDRLVTMVPIHFKPNRASIQRRSYPILRQVAALMRARPWIKGLLVEGHTDNRGTKSFNMRLSQRRARRVRRFLIRRGLPSRRVTATGFGDTKPIAIGCRDMKQRQERKKCYQKNRRVVFRLMR